MSENPAGARFDAEGQPPPELSHAGAIVDKAIEYMAGQGLPPLAIASALLGGSLGLLANTMDDAAILRVLDNAAASVRSGELRMDDGFPHPAAHA